MLRDLGLDPNLSLDKRTFKVQLALPNHTITQNVNNINVPELSDVGLNKMPHLEFEIPYLIKIKNVDDKNGTYIKNPDLITIKEEKMIKLTWYNDQVLWFRINSLVKTENGGEKTIKVICDGAESELRKTKISLTGTGISVEEYFTQALEQTGWTLGTISDGLKETYRTFDDENDITKYEAVQNGIETFGAVADFDGETRTLNLYTINDVRVNRGVVLKKENYASSIEITSDTEEIVTRLYIKGSEDLTIESVNPTGMRYIEDFSYFIYPFERDENKNVIKHSAFMSDDLAHALLDLQELKEEYLPEIQSERAILDEAYADLSSISLTKVELDNQLITAQSLLDTAKATNDLPLVSQREKELSAKENEVKTAQETLDNIQATIDALEKRIAEIQALISISSFNTKKYNELMLFVYEKDFTDDRYIDAESLYEAGKVEFEKYQTPKHTFTVEMESFLNQTTSARYKGKLQLGEEVLVKSKDLDESYTSIIVGFSGELQTGNYKVEISDSMDDVNSMDKLVTLLYQSESSASTISNNKYKWDNITSVKDEVSQWRDKEITTVNNRIIAGANESISIDNRGMIVTNPDFPDERIIIQSGVVALSKDGGKTWSTSITPNGVIAETLIGKIIAGNNLIITNDSGSFVIDNDGLKIDMNSIQIMSGDSGNPENVINSWNQLLLSYSEIASDNLVNEYEKKQLSKQWTSIVDINSSMVNAFNKGWGSSTEAKPKEYNDYLTAYEELNTYLNKTKQTDGFALFDESNQKNTTEIVPETFRAKFKNYEVTKQALESIISLEFTKSQILVLEEGIKLQYVKNDNVVTQLNLSEEGIKIDGKLLEINSDTEFNANLTMNAGVIQDKEGAIKIDLNKGEIVLNKPITIGSDSNLATKTDIANLEQQYLAVLTNDMAVISTDANGSQGTYANAVTEMNIYKAGVLDNANWTFTLGSMTDVVGTLTSNKLVVTSIKNDTANIVINAKKDKFTLTKTFTLNKVKNGGIVSRYWIMTPDVIHKDNTGVYSPTSVTVLGNIQTGTGNPTSYAGRYKISETTDGTNFTVKYTSTADEATKSYTPNAGIKAIKVQFYLSGGMVFLLDEQTIPVVEDGLTSIIHTAFAYNDSGTDRLTTYIPTLNMLNGTRKNSSLVGNNTTNQTNTMYTFDSGNLSTQKLSVGDKIICDFDWEVSSPTSGTFYVQITAYPWNALSGTIAISSTNSSGHSSYIHTANTDFIASTAVGVAIRLDNVPASSAVTISNFRLKRGTRQENWMPSASEVVPSDYPNYTGTYIDFEKTQSLVPSKYEWVLNRGKDMNGFVAYSFSSDGSDRFIKYYPENNLIRNSKYLVDTNLANDVLTSPILTTGDVTIKSGGLQDSNYASLTARTVATNADYFRVYLIPTTQTPNMPSYSVKPNTKYTFSCYLRGSGTHALFSYNAWTYNNTAVTIRPKSTTEWEKVEFTVTSLSTIPTSNVQFFFRTAEIGATMDICLAKVEENETATLWTPHGDEAVANDFPIYIGTADKDSDNYADYKWELYSKWILTSTNEVLLEKADQAELDEVSDVANNANVLAQNAVPQEVYTSWLEHDYQETIDSINATSEESKADIVSLEGRTTAVEAFYGNMKVKWNFIDEAFSFSEEGMFISNSNSQMAIQITSDKIVFWDNDNDVATITGEYLNIKKGIFLESAIIGNHQITKFSDDSPVTIIRYIGGL